MSKPIPLQDEFLGMYRDKSRDALPKGKCWNLVDYIPDELGAPLRKRGGWSYAEDALTDIDASAGLPVQVALFDVSGVNELRYVVLYDDVTGYWTGNVYTLTFRGQTTGSLAYGDTAATVQSALEALSNIAPGDVTVTDMVNPELSNHQVGGNTATKGFFIEFTGTLAAQDIVANDFTGTFPTGGTGPPIPLGAQGTERNGGGSGSRIVAVDDRADPELIDLTAGTDEGSIYGGTKSAPLGPMVAYRNNLLIPSPELASSPTGPRKYDGSSVAALGGSPPGIRFFCVHKGRVVGLSADTDTPNRVVFGGSSTDAGDPESWDANRYIDTAAEPIGAASLGNSLLIFHAGSVERIRGSIPPGSPAANMELEPLWGDVGLISPFALQTSDALVYWADENGVYRSDGSSDPANLAKQLGFGSYWRDQMEIVGTGGKVSLAVSSGYVWISLVDGADNYVDFIKIDLQRRLWFRYSNIKAYNFAIQSGAEDEIYFSNRDSSNSQIGKLSTVFDPAANTIDANGNEIKPILETPIYMLEDLGTKRWKHIYLDYMMPGASNPTFSFSYMDDPLVAGGTGFGSLGETQDRRVRSRLMLGRVLRGLGLKIEQSTSSADTAIYSIEADVAAREGSRRG